MVAVSAGDSLESVMAAYGSGAVARSIRVGAPVMNVDIGGGTAKIAVCAEGKVTDVTALDVGARLIVLDGSRHIVRLEEAGRSFGAELGLKLQVGSHVDEEHARALAARMTDSLFEAMHGGSPHVSGAALLRLDPLSFRGTVSDVSFSGGVSEYIYGGEAKAYGDLGPQLAAEVRARVKDWGPELARPDARIRATVIGASQYTMQVSGSTIFVSPLETLPLRNVPVIAPPLPLGEEKIESAAIAAAVKAALRRLDLADGQSPVAVFIPWRGSATYRRLDDFCKGIAEGLEAVLAQGHPIVLAGDGDVGGLIGIHYCEEMKIRNPIVSIDGLELKDFDYIDIGAILDTSGAVPVVIKSLIFPTSAGLGRDWEAERATTDEAASTS
jgi:ethanolamine utilization protein EutA